MICKVCKEEIKKNTIRGIKECEIIGCERIVPVRHRICKKCSEERNECQVCTAKQTKRKED